MQRLLQKARKTRRRRRSKNGNAGRHGQLEKREQRGKNKTCFRFSYGSICFFYGSNCFSHGSTCFPPESICLSRVFPPFSNVPAGEDRTAGSAHSDMNPPTVLPAPGGHSPAGKERVGEERLQTFPKSNRTHLSGCIRLLLYPLSKEGMPFLKCTLFILIIDSSYQLSVDN